MINGIRVDEVLAYQHRLTGRHIERYQEAQKKEAQKKQASKKAGNRIAVQTDQVAGQQAIGPIAHPVTPSPGASPLSRW